MAGEDRWSIMGNQIIGFSIAVKLGTGEWVPISKRFTSYDEACKKLDKLLEEEGAS